MASIQASTSTSSNSTRKSKMFLPLSNHGMPKTPLQASLGRSARPHRFSTKDSTSLSIINSPPMSPMSPPMSAKSFGTFIDSEPSTPAYSPRMGTGWDSSTLMLLSPVSTAPSSPPEPEWEMMSPVRKPSKSSAKPKAATSYAKEVSWSTTPSPSHFIKAMQEDAQKENRSPQTDEIETEVADNTSTTEAKKKKKEEAAEAPLAAPLEKLATKMKSMLRRRPTVGEKKSDKRRKYQDLDRMEDVHWTDL